MLTTFNDLPTDMHIEILKKLNRDELIKCSLLNKKFKIITRKTKWNNVIVYIYHTECVKYIRKYYNFSNYAICNLTITDMDIHRLNFCHTLDLSNCFNLTDNALKYLSNCHTLNLSGCNLITDEGLKYLSKCHTLNLSGCYKITDNGIRYLYNCQKLILIGCWRISENIKSSISNNGNFIFIK